MLNFNATDATLNNLVDIFLSIANDHEMIHSFGWGAEYDINAVTVENYPLLWVYANPATINDGSILYKFRFIFADIVDASQNNEREIYSDAIRVLQDIMYQLRDNYQLNISWGATVTPFTLQYADSLAGWFVDLSIDVPQTNSNCTAPFLNN